MNHTMGASHVSAPSWQLVAYTLRRELPRVASELESGDIEGDAIGRHLSKLQREFEAACSLLEAAPGMGPRFALWRLERAWKHERPKFELAILDFELHKSRTERNARLRTLRAEVSDLRQALSLLRTGKTSFETYKPFLEETADHIGQLFTDYGLHVEESETDDTHRHLLHLWEQIRTMLRSALANSGARAFDEVLPTLDTVDGLCREFAFIVGYRTIPERLNRWLAKAWNGTTISFHDVFEDEVPELEDRQKILRFLTQTPAKIPEGLIDATTGLVYRHHRDRARQVMSGFRLGLLFLVCTAAIAFGPWLWRGVNWSTALQFTTWWAALVCGVAFHGAADRFKSTRGGGVPAMSPEHIWTWLDARSGVLMWRLATAVIGFVGALLIFGSTLTKAEGAGTALFNMFLVGYGLDSFVGIFTSSMEKRTAALLQKTTKQLEA